MLIMEPYFELNSLIRNDRPIEEITHYVHENRLSGQTFSTFEDCSKANLPCPIDQAAFHGRLDVINVLYTVGFNPNALHGCFLGFDLRFSPWIRCSAIHLATHSGRLSVIRSLVEEYGVDVNSEDSQQFCALHQAILSESCMPEIRLPIVKYLVEAGAHFESSRQGMKPIHFAACNNLCDVCEYLLSKGARVIDETNPSGAPIMAAACRGNDLCIRLLLENAKGLNVHEVFQSKDTLLHTCARRAQIDSVRLLCSLGSNSNAQNSSGQTPLHYAVRALKSGLREDVLRVLHFLIIEQNVSLDLVDRGSETAFDQALDLTDVHVVKLFLLAGYRPENRRGRKQNCLEALANENRPIQQLLSSPRKLQDLSCFRVRRALGRRLPSAVKSLPLPNKMKYYVQLAHIPIPKWNEF